MEARTDTFGIPERGQEDVLLREDMDMLLTNTLKRERRPWDTIVV